MIFGKNGKTKGGTPDPERTALFRRGIGGILAIGIFGLILFSEGCGRKGDPVAPKESGPERMLHTGNKEIRLNER